MPTRVEIKTNLSYTPSEVRESCDDILRQWKRNEALRLTLSVGGQTIIIPKENVLFWTQL